MTVLLMPSLSFPPPAAYDYGWVSEQKMCNSVTTKHTLYIPDYIL